MNVSIAMATYNGAKYLREQLNSIVSQSYADFELIVGDDCSSDCTMEILREFQKKDNRIQIFRNEKNVGFKKNFEKILSRCSGKYVAFCDQDDVWAENHLEILLKNIGDCDCVGANADIVDSYGQRIGQTMQEHLKINIVPRNNHEILCHQFYDNIIQGTASMFRKSFLDSFLPIPNNVKLHDYWFATNACYAGGCKYITDVVLLYRRHATAITGYEKFFSPLRALNTIKQLPQNRKKFYEDYLGLLESLPTGPDYCCGEREIALTFYRDVMDDKNRFRSIVHYLKNYNSITLCRKRQFVLFFYRLMCLVLFGIKR